MNCLVDSLFSRVIFADDEQQSFFQFLVPNLLNKIINFHVALLFLVLYFLRENGL